MVYLRAWEKHESQTQKEKTERNNQGQGKINEMEITTTIKSLQRVNKMSQFFEKVNKISKPLAKLTKEKKTQP